MSKVGKLPVAIPAGVTVTVANNVVTVKGPKGELKQDFSSDLKVEVKDNEVVVSLENTTKQANAFHGLYRNLINNMVVGVTTGFTKTLVITGVGYRAEIQGKLRTASAEVKKKAKEILITEATDPEKIRLADATVETLNKILAILD